MPYDVITPYGPTAMGQLTDAERAAQQRALAFQMQAAQEGNARAAGAPAAGTDDFMSDMFKDKGPSLETQAMQARNAAVDAKHAAESQAGGGYGTDAYFTARQEARAKADQATSDSQVAQAKNANVVKRQSDLTALQQQLAEIEHGGITDEEMPQYRRAKAAMQDGAMPDFVAEAVTTEGKKLENDRAKFSLEKDRDAYQRPVTPAPGVDAENVLTLPTVTRAGYEMLGTIQQVKKMTPESINAAGVSMMLQSVHQMAGELTKNGYRPDQAMALAQKMALTALPDAGKPGSVDYQIAVGAGLLPGEPSNRQTGIGSIGPFTPSNAMSVPGQSPYAGLTITNGGALR